MQRRKINVLKMYFIFPINGLMSAGLDMKWPFYLTHMGKNVHKNLEAISSKKLFDWTSETPTSLYTHLQKGEVKMKSDPFATIQSADSSRQKVLLIFTPTFHYINCHDILCYLLC